MEVSRFEVIIFYINCFITKRTMYYIHFRQVHYPPETSSIMLIVRLLARIIQSPNRDAAIEQTLQFCHRTVNEDEELAHNLLGEKFTSQISLLHNLLVAAIPHDGIEQFLTPAGFQGLLALIGEFFNYLSIIYSINYFFNYIM